MARTANRLAQLSQGPALDPTSSRSGNGNSPRSADSASDLISQLLNAFPGFIQGSNLIIPLGPNSPGGGLGNPNGVSGSNGLGGSNGLTGPNNQPGWNGFPGTSGLGELQGLTGLNGANGQGGLDPFGSPIPIGSGAGASPECADGSGNGIPVGLGNGFPNMLNGGSPNGLGNGNGLGTGPLNTLTLTVTVIGATPLASPPFNWGASENGNGNGNWNGNGNGNGGKASGSYCVRMKTDMLSEQWPWCSLSDGRFNRW